MRRTPASEWRDHLKPLDAVVVKQEQMRRARQIFRGGKLVRARYVGPTPQRIGQTALIRECGYEGHVLVQFDDLSDPFSHGWHPMRAEKFEVLR